MFPTYGTLCNKGLTILVSLANRSPIRSLLCPSTRYHSNKVKSNPVIVRDALHADFDDVIGMDRNVYRGRDYLPSVYHRNLGLSTCKAVVCHSTDAGIVAYCAGHLEANDRMLVLTAGRVKVSHRGQGLTRRMLETIRNHFLSQGVPIQYEVMLGKEKEMTEKKHSGYVKLFERRMMNFELDTQRVLSSIDIRKYAGKISIFDYQGIGSYTSDTLTSLEDIMRSDWLQVICPEKIIVGNWMPHRVPTLNVDYFLHNNSFIVVSKPDAFVQKSSKINTISNCSHHVVNDTTTVTSTTPEDDKYETACSGSYGVFSVGNFFPCRLGFAYNLDLYFSTEDFSSTSTVGQHIANHMALAAYKASSWRSDNVHVLVHFNDSEAHKKTLVHTMANLYEIHPTVDEITRMRFYWKKRSS